MNNGIVYLPDTIDYTVAYNTNCNVGAWVHYNKTGDPLHKLLGMSGFTTAELNNFAVTITPEGTSYDDGTRMSQLMPRIAYVANSNVAPLSTGKVRVYYSVDEMNQTILPGAASSRWYKYEGNADDVLTDVYNDGLLAGSKAVALTPAASGTENGVSYVEFHNISSFSSFVFLSSSEIVPLPIKSLEFTARGQYGKALLEWSTIGTENIGSFEVERSADANQWNAIAAVAGKSAGTNNSEKLEYLYTDETPLAGNNYYRLKLADRNGQYEYSSVRRLLFGSAGSVITVAPNPVSSEVFINGLTGSSMITVSNLLGQVIMRSAVNAGSCSMDLSQYKPGAYFIYIRQENGSVSSHKIIKE